MRAICLRPWATARISFLAWRPDHGETEEDAHTVSTVDDPQTAAEDFAQWSDSNGDYLILGGAVETIVVRRVGSESTETFEVTGESVPSYTARRKS